MIEEIKKLINEKLDYHAQLMETRLNYSKDYAYRSLISYKHDPKLQEQANANCQWHDGSRDGHQAAMGSLEHILTKIQELEQQNETDN